MKVYSTLSREKEEFTPQEPGRIKMYVCGPTVYNYITVANARPFVVFDTVRRYFEYRGYEVDFATNFTDVDDRIINRAMEENTNFEAISERYIAETLKDAEGLNIKPDTRYPRASEEIDGMIEMIQTLIDKGYAYENNGTVYFEAGKFVGYGKLSRKNTEELEAGARIEVDEDKRAPMDFVLWKPAKPGEPFWPSPWGDGRPGWHIECSVMSKKYLGETLDIHAGGIDIMFPHHENEIAQSEAANGKTFARYWMHNGSVNVDNVKMSKSKGNFITMREAASQYSYMTVRFFYLSSHYRSPINFSAELLRSAQTAFERIKNCVSKLSYIADNNADGKLTEDERGFLRLAEGFTGDFERSMDDDLNTADAVAAIFDYVKFANINTAADSSGEFARLLADDIMKLCSILGLKLEDEKKTEDDTKEIEELIEQRQQARKNKDWASADRIRDELNKKGVILEDTPSGIRWRRS